MEVIAPRAETGRRGSAVSIAAASVIGFTSVLLGCAGPCRDPCPPPVEIVSNRAASTGQHLTFHLDPNHLGTRQQICLMYSSAGDAGPEEKNAVVSINGARGVAEDAGQWPDCNAFFRWTPLPTPPFVLDVSHEDGQGSVGMTLSFDDATCEESFPGCAL
jgi:hypothetical protein